jgi:5-methylthioadenosine/S-adenosylhomocysteine deaminase
VPVPALRQAGIPVGVGTDRAASNDSQNMLEAVKAAALLQKVARLDPRALTAGDALAMATIEGHGPGPGRAGRFPRAGQAGRPGPAAGRPARPAQRPRPRQQVVYCASSTDVADVWVDGERRVADGHLVGHDLAALVEASRPLAAELVTRAGLERFSRLAALSGGRARWRSPC